jgi:hypothetical protein
MASAPYQPAAANAKPFAWLLPTLAEPGAIGYRRA